MPEVIINASGPQYGMVVNSDGSINTVVSGISINIGSAIINLEDVYIASGNNITGSFYPLYTNPTATNQFNYKTVLVYSGAGIGSIFREHSTGSWVQTLTYSGASITNISAWSAV